MNATAGVWRNRLLAALPREVLERWLVHLEPEEMRLGDTVHEPGRPMPHAHFPTTAVVSLLHVMQEGASAEIAIVGRDGVVGMSPFAGDASTSTHGVVQGGGLAYRLPQAVLRDELARGGAAAELLLRFTQALLCQVTQTAACNRHHHIEQQLCRWLLLSLDRIDGDELVMTQELISHMLGVRREGVTQAALSLQRQGVIQYSRGHIVVPDRTLLEARTCECYATVEKTYERLLPRRARPAPASH